MFWTFPPSLSWLLLLGFELDALFSPADRFIVKDESHWVSNSPQVVWRRKSEFAEGEITRNCIIASLPLCHENNQNSRSFPRFEISRVTSFKSQNHDWFLPVNRYVIAWWCLRNWLIRSSHDFRANWWRTAYGDSSLFRMRHQVHHRHPMIASNKLLINCQSASSQAIRF